MNTGLGLPASLLMAGLLLIGGCGRHAVFPETEEYIVATGDTVFSIAWSQELDYRELARWNGIKPPYRIYPGQRLVLHPFGRDTADAVDSARPSPATAGRKVETTP
ncbi:MAG: LysM peptidoglycan-binding domain-containing protein, partial [Acidobacteria bacterium]|nr:LysM peptidoglycan-binding domain-containing protein [Acidobacteriota bacterium]